MITSLRPETFENLQLNSGVFLFNFDASSYATVEALEDAVLAALEAGTDIMGATIGGGSFNATPSIRQIEADGMRYPVVGSTQNDMWTVNLSTTMKEVTPENFKRALMTCDMTKEGNVTKLEVRTDIKPSDYIPRCSWVGDTSRGFVLIELDNVLNIAGAAFTFTDRGEGQIPVEFQAHVGDLSKMDKAPFRIWFFDEEEAA